MGYSNSDFCLASAVSHISRIDMYVTLEENDDFPVTMLNVGNVKML
jgi:hypothetical protein